MEKINQTKFERKYFRLLKKLLKLDPMKGRDALVKFYVKYYNKYHECYPNRFSFMYNLYFGE